MKKILSVFLSLCLLLCAAPSVSARDTRTESVFTIDKLNFGILDENPDISSYTAIAENLMNGLSIETARQTEGNTKLNSFAVRHQDNLIMDLSLFDNGDGMTLVHSSLFGNQLIGCRPEDQFFDKLLNATAELLGIDRNSVSTLPTESVSQPNEEVMAALTELMIPAMNIVLRKISTEEIAEAKAPFIPELPAKEKRSFEWPDVSEFSAPAAAATRISGTYDKDDIAALLNILGEKIIAEPALMSWLDRVLASTDMTGRQLAENLVNAAEELKTADSSVMITVKYDIDESGKPVRLNCVMFSADKVRVLDLDINFTETAKFVTGTLTVPDSEPIALNGLILNNGLYLFAGKDSDIQHLETACKWNDNEISFNIEFSPFTANFTLYEDGSAYEGEIHAKINRQTVFEAEFHGESEETMTAESPTSQNIVYASDLTDEDYQGLALTAVMRLYISFYDIGRVKN